MHAGVVLTLVRAVILLGLLLAFTYSLVAALISDQAGGRSDLSRAAGRDPGLRVLLLDRRDSEHGPQRYHEKLVIDVLRPTWLLAPDQPDNPVYQRKLEPSEQLT
nr:hypothetical protein [Planctomycetota bacterium]